MALERCVASSVLCCAVLCCAALLQAHEGATKQEAVAAWEEERRVSRCAPIIRSGTHVLAGGRMHVHALHLACTTVLHTHAPHIHVLHTRTRARTCITQTRAHRYAKDLPQLDSGRKISPNPSDWRCDETGATENLWLNLSTGHIGSGRQVCVCVSIIYWGGGCLCAVVAVVHALQKRASVCLWLCVCMCARGCVASPVLGWLTAPTSAQHCMCTPHSGHYHTVSD
jgi:hypothetical protein